MRIFLPQLTQTLLGLNRRKNNAHGNHPTKVPWVSGDDYRGWSNTP